MSVYVVGYDLNRKGQDYKGLYTAIQSLGGYMHYLDSTWLVVTNASASQIFEKLDPYIDGNDNLLVIQVNRDWYARLPQEALDWLRQHV